MALLYVRFFRDPPKRAHDVPVGAWGDGCLGNLGGALGERLSGGTEEVGKHEKDFSQ